MTRYLFRFISIFALGVMPLVGSSETTGDGGSGGMGGIVELSLTTYEGDGWVLHPRQHERWCAVIVDVADVSSRPEPRPSDKSVGRPFVLRSRSAHETRCLGKSSTRSHPSCSITC